MKDETALYYALSTLAQCATALAALIGFLRLWRLDRLREEETRAEQALFEVVWDSLGPSDRKRRTRALLMERGWQLLDNPALQPQLVPKLKHALDRCTALPGEQQRLMDVLVIFLLGTLAVLVLAIGLISFSEALYPWVWTMRVCITGMSLWLGVPPAYVVLQAAGGAPVWLQVWRYVRPWRGPGRGYYTAAGPMASPAQEKPAMTPADEARFIALWTQGVDTAEIAQRLGIPRGTVGSRAHRLVAQGKIQPRPRGGCLSPE